MRVNKQTTSSEYWEDKTKKNVLGMPLLASGETVLINATKYEKIPNLRFKEPSI